MVDSEKRSEIVEWSGTVWMAEAIHQDDGKGKREKKERWGGSVGVSNDNDAPGFAVG